jgi:hypothetical protein
MILFNNLDLQGFENLEGLKSKYGIQLDVYIKVSDSYGS